MYAAHVWIALIYSLVGSSMGDSSHLWIMHSKDATQTECFVIDYRYYCRPVVVNSSVASCKDGQLWSFEKLKELNATTEDLINWLIPFALIEQYAADFHDDNEDIRTNEAAICNCSEHRIGKECEYSYPSRTTMPGEWLDRQMADTHLYNDETLTRFVDGIVCPGAKGFLEWRHICDGFSQCHNGADELDCHLLEYFQCKSDEFQCRNGMCIPLQFVFDAMPDCMDGSDEQELDELSKRYYQCTKQSSFDCDDRLCRKDQFSCGNGECVPWTAVLNDQIGCENARHIAYVCEISNLWVQVWREWPGICRETMKVVPLLTSNSDCRESLGHLLQTKPNQQLSALAVTNLRARCDALILYSDQNAFFPGLKMLYNRSRIERFFSNPSNSHKPILKTPDLYYFIGDIICDGVLVKLSNSVRFDQHEWQQLASYPFFPLSHLLCQKVTNRSLNNLNTESDLNSSISSFSYRCKNTSDRVALRRINDGYIDCLYGDDERNNDYPMAELFRYHCQTVTSPPQYVSYAKLGNGVEDCADGSDEISKELRWATFKCDVNDNYECWVFQGDQFGEHRLKDARLQFHRYCDSVWDVMDGRDEKNCSQWICDRGLRQCDRTGQCIEAKFLCDGEFDCDDGEDEMNCSQGSQRWDFELRCNNSTEYFCVTDEYIKDPSLNRSCTPRQRLGDGHIDCIGARDERNTVSCPDRRMLGDRFLCDDGKRCIDYTAICNGIKDCIDETDESICYWNTGWCSAGRFSCADQNGCKSARCQRLMSCNDRSHNFWCPKSINENNVYRSGKIRTVVDNKKRCYNQPQSQIVSSEAPSRSNQQVKQSSIRYFYCNRGFYLYANNSFEPLCFCPSTFYGDRCQFSSRRVGIRLRFDRAYRSDLPLLLNVLVTLVLNESIIVDHRFFLDEAKEHPAKFNTYLIYPRPKPPGTYSVRVEVYHSTELIHFWTYSVSPLDFLPVLRLVKVLRFPARALPWLCLLNYCRNNGTCHQQEDNQFLCICTRNWKGRLCDVRTEHIRCAPHSLARTENICVCPQGFLKPSCYVQNLKCQRHSCAWNQTCIPRSYPPIHGHTCICNTPNCNINRLVLSLYRQKPNHVPFLIQLLQLAGDYPKIRQQILIPSMTSFPLTETIKTRDYRSEAGGQPEIGLLFTFESAIDSIESRLYLLFINCSTAQRNLSVDLSLPLNECRVLPETERYAVTLFASFCRNFTYGTCFISDGYLCYCGYPTSNQSNCLSYQRRYPTCNYCQNQGHCVQGDLTNRSDFTCVCPKCVTGVLCQFSPGRFSISLEFLIEKTDWGQGHLIAPTLLFIIGLIFNSLSIITFRQQKLRNNGVALHLLATSVLSLSVLILLLVRVIYLYMIRRIIITEGVNTVMCKSFPMLMYTFYYVILWLMAMVTVERAMAAVQYSQWASFQKPKKAIALIIVIMLIVLSSNYIFVKQYQLVNHPDYSFPWCIREVPPSEQLLTQVLGLIHQVIPFLVNLIAALVIILAITQSKKHVHGQSTHDALIDQTRKRINLLVGPIACFLAQLAEIVILFLNACDYEQNVWFSKLTLLTYYVSFAPQTSIFFLYIVPSKHYYTIFLKDTAMGQYLVRLIRGFK